MHRDVRNTYSIALIALSALAATPASQATGVAGMLDPQALFEQADTNHDGKVSREEFANGGGAMFDRADANHDGVVDKAEMQQAAERLKSLREP